MAPGARKPGAGGGAEGVDIALNPDELDLDTAAMTAKYEQQMKEQQLQVSTTSCSCCKMCDEYQLCNGEFDCNDVD